MRTVVRRASVLAGISMLGVVALRTSPAAAHARLVTPAPRDQQDGYKDPPRGPGGPCGIARMIPPQPQTDYAPGQPLTVQWDETVSHPGCFVVDFAAADDADFQILGVKSHAGAVGNPPRHWSVDVTLPSTPCAACTLRVRQLMLGADLPEAQCPPATIPAGSTYYTCANVTLGGNGDPGGTGAGGASGGGGASGSSGSGGGCAAAGTRPASALAALLVAAAVLTAARRRRAPRR